MLQPARLIFEPQSIALALAAQQGDLAAIRKTYKMGKPLCDRYGQVSLRIQGEGTITLLSWALVHQQYALVETLLQDNKSFATCALHLDQNNRSHNLFDEQERVNSRSLGPGVIALLLEKPTLAAQLSQLEDDAGYIQHGAYSVRVAAGLEELHKYLNLPPPKKEVVTTFIYHRCAAHHHYEDLGWDIAILDRAQLLDLAQLAPCYQRLKELSGLEEKQLQALATAYLRLQTQQQPQEHTR